MAELAERVPLRRYCVIPQSIQKRMNQHPLCKILYLTEIGYEAETAFRPFKKQAVGNHFLLVYVASGEGWYSVRAKTFYVKENDYFVLSHELAGNNAVRALKQRKESQGRVPELKNIVHDLKGFQPVIADQESPKT